MIVFDMDGTLAIDQHRRHFIDGLPDNKKQWDKYFSYCYLDPPNMPALMVFAALAAAGHEIEIWTGRTERIRPETEVWLDKHLTHLLPPRQIKMLMRGHADYRPDVELKGEWLDAQRGNVQLAFDDRDSVVKMWRDAGVPCFQVAVGAF